MAVLGKTVYLSYVAKDNQTPFRLKQGNNIIKLTKDQATLLFPKKIREVMQDGETYRLVPMN